MTMDRPARSRIPAGLLGCLALIAAVEAGVARRPLQFADTASLSWRLAFESAPREAGGCRVACLGDSLVKIGVMPRIIEAGTGLPAHNFAMAQAPAPATYFLLRRLLGAGARPSALIVDFKPSVLVGGPKYSLRPCQEALTLRESVDLAIEANNPRLFAELVAGRAFASVRSRLEVREAIRFTLFGLASPTARNNRLGRRNWASNLGAHLNPWDRHFDGAIDPDHLRRLSVDRWKCDPTNARFVDRLLGLADAHAIPVFWLVPPPSPPLQAAREASGVDAAYSDFIRGRQAAHPTLTVVDARHSGYGATEFADATHLNGRGATALSHELAAIVGRRQEQPRWVDLPAYRERPADPLAEDLDRSRLALQAEGITRR